MNAEDRAQIAGHLRILSWKESPGLAQELAASHAAMDAGKKISQEQVERFMAERRGGKK